MTVATICYDVPLLQVEIASKGGIVPLIKRLTVPSSLSQANAAGALWSLAQNVDNQARKP